MPTCRFGGSGKNGPVAPVRLDPCLGQPGERAPCNPSGTGLGSMPRHGEPFETQVASKLRRKRVPPAGRAPPHTRQGRAENGQEQNRKRAREAAPAGRRGRRLRRSRRRRRARTPPSVGGCCPACGHGCGAARFSIVPANTAPMLPLDIVPLNASPPSCRRRNPFPRARRRPGMRFYRHN